MTKKTLILLFSLFVSSLTYAAEHHPQEFLDSIRGLPNAGHKIYQHFCSTCHAFDPLICVGAPRVGIRSDWESYMKTQTVDQMVKAIDSGIGAMPPRGGCFECSDDDLKAAIIYMLPE